MTALYQPSVPVRENASAKGSRHSLRIRDLTKKIIATDTIRKIKVGLFQRAYKDGDVWKNSATGFRRNASPGKAKITGWASLMRWSRD
jgi:hypothetical protein